MKLVLDTQVHENYGDSSDPYWKPKGGHVYVVENLPEDFSVEERMEMVVALRKLIEQDGAYVREVVIRAELMWDGAMVCEEWESPTTLTLEGGVWIARRVSKNLGWMRSCIAEKREQYRMLNGGEMEDCQSWYLMTDGRLLTYKQLEKELETA